MVQKGTKVAGEAADGEGAAPALYVIDEEVADRQRRSLALMVAGRRCYICQQEDEDQPSASSKVGPYIKRIAQHCADTSDFLLPDTPLKEAMFRVILSGGNEPKTAEEISQTLSGKWTMSPYPRNLSPEAIQRLLDHSESYCIARLPVEEPEPEAGKPADKAEEKPIETPAEDESES